LKGKKSDICVICAKNHRWPWNWGWLEQNWGLCARPGPQTATGNS